MNSTLAQRRSLFALEKVKEASGIDKFDKLTAGLPPMILQNGFGQVLAFLLAKTSGNDEKRYKLAFDTITLWLKERKLISKTEKGEVMHEISSMPQEKYLLAQEEALALLEWVKRYANAQLFK